MPSRRRKPTPKAKGKAGRRRARAVGARLNITELARVIRHDRGTVSDYLKRPGAPRPDGKQRFDVAAAREFIESQSPKLSNSAEVAKLRETLLRIEAEEKQLSLDERKGRVVDKKKIEPTIAAAMKGLTADMQLKFEQELPAKYEGLDRVARAKLNADAIDWIMNRFKFGTAPITT